MKKFLLLLLISVMATAALNAKIRRVGFFGPFISGEDYSTFAAAYTAAAAGDTILIFPGVPALNQTFTKKLILIGTGDFLDPNSTPKGNANMQAFAGVATVYNLIFSAGSEGSIVMGFEGGTYDVRASNITITRNNNCVVYLAVGAATYSNLQILENYNVNISYGSATASNVTNINVSNNLIYSFNTSPGNTYSGNISNNVWAYDATQSAGNANGGSSTMSYPGNIELGGGAYLLQNNIFVSYTNSSVPSNTNYFTFSNGGNSVFNYNLALQSSTPINWGTGTGNVITSIANASAIFAAFPLIGTTSADARYKLGASSPAATVGSGSTPIGMFAGTNPYKLSMIPAVPTIYKLSSPQGNNPTGSTITINLSTRGNN
jgi:hypothetical protein